MIASEASDATQKLGGWLADTARRAIWGEGGSFGSMGSGCSDTVFPSRRSKGKCEATASHGRALRTEVQGDLTSVPCGPQFVGKMRQRALHGSRGPAAFRAESERVPRHLPHVGL